jgi:hypothetical protein
MQCPLKDNSTVDLYADEKYMEVTAKYVALEMHSQYSEDSMKTYDLTPIIYILIAVMFVILTLFIFMGMKNRKMNKK